MKFQHKLVAPFLVIALCFFAVLPLLSSHFYPMHDDEQIGRLYDLDQSIKAGHIPPRIVPNLGFGYGYPFFNFYPPFAYYVGEVYHLIGFGYVLSTKLMLITGFILSAIFMYVLVKEFFGRFAGLVSAVSYTYISYKAVDVYVRGAYAEFFSFVFIPLIFWSIYKLTKDNKIKYLLFCSLGTAGLILSHNLIAFVSSFFIGVWILYSLYISKNKPLFFSRVIGALLLGFGLSAYFFLPSYIEKDYTLVNILTKELADYKLHFVCVYQLWDSTWGYGGSILGCYDGISFEIGKVQLVISLASSLVALFLLSKHKKVKLIIPILIFSVFLFTSLFLMIKYSRFVWDIIPSLWYIQFPWRFLVFAGFSASFLTGSIIIFIRGKILRYIIGLLIIFTIILTSISRFTPQRFINVNDKSYTSLEKIRWETSSLSYEYVPSGIATKKSQAGTTQVDITKEQIASSSSQIINGVMEIQEKEDRPQYKKFELKVFEPGIVQINTFSFPGWKVFIDGRLVTFNDNNKFKLIRISVPEGTHILEAKFTDTPVIIIGNTTTVISIIILAILSSIAVKTNKHTVNSRGAPRI